MMKVQSFPWAVKPISKSERESKVVKRTTDSIALEVETGLQAISAEARALLLKPYIEESLSYHRDKLKSELAQDMQDKLEKELQNRVGLAIAPLKENIELEEKKRRNKVENLIEHLLAPEVKKTQIEPEQVLSLSLTIVEKILAQKVVSKSCYCLWVDSIIGATQGHLSPVLRINQQDYDVLLEYELIGSVNKKVGCIEIAEVANFSFELESIRGQSGHDSLAILQQLQMLLKNQGDSSD